MKVLIDCGSHSGNAIRSLRRQFGTFDKTHLFECNPLLIGGLRKQVQDDTSIQIHEQAVWINDGIMPFYVGTENSESSSLIRGKRGTNPRYSVTVPTLDFANWLESNFTQGEEIVLKMDIEGAEYPVLERMIETKAIRLIQVLCCEWHAGRRLPPKEQSRKRHLCLLERLQHERLKFVRWR